MLTPAERARAAARVEQLLGLYLCAGNLDLVAELLLCWRALRRPAAELVAAGRRRLEEAQLAEGAIPGARFSGQADAALPAGERDGYRFDRCYHTTLVAAVAAWAWGWVRLDGDSDGDEDEGGDRDGR